MITNEIALFTTFEMRTVLFMLICLQHHPGFYHRSRRCRQTILLLPRIRHQQCIIPREVAGSATSVLLFLRVNQKNFHCISGSYRELGEREDKYDLMEEDDKDDGSECREGGDSKDYEELYSTVEQ